MCLLKSYTIKRKKQCGIDAENRLVLPWPFCLKMVSDMQRSIHVRQIWKLPPPSVLDLWCRIGLTNGIVLQYGP